MNYNPKHPLLERKDRAFQKLFNVESEFMAAQGYSDNDQKARLRGLLVTIIDKLSKCREFDAFVPYLAVNYLDRFLSRKQNLPLIEGSYNKNIKLFATCCLTLAWKMRCPTFSVPEFMRINSIENPLFVTKMEIQILNALEWRMRTVTAISFLEYFYPFFKLRHPQPIEGFSRRDISKTLITIQGDIKFTKFKPSIIAASAVLSASFKAFPAQFLLRAEEVLRCQYIDKGALLQCMEAMGIEILVEVKVITRAIKLEEEKKIEEAIKTEQAKKMEEAKKIENLKELKDINEKLKAQMERERIEKETKMKEARKIAEDINEKLKACTEEITMEEAKKIEDLKELIDVSEKLKRHTEQKRIENETKMEEARKIEKAEDNSEKLKKIEEAKKIEELIAKDIAKNKKYIGIAEVIEEIEKKKQEKERNTGRKMGDVKKTEEAKKIEEGVDIKDKGKCQVDEGAGRKIGGIKIGDVKKIEEGVDIKDKGKRKVDEGVEAKKPKTDPTKAEVERRPRRQGGKKVPRLGTIQEEDDDYDYESSLEEEEDVVMDFELNWPVAELEGDLNVPDPIPEQRAAASPSCSVL